MRLREAPSRALPAALPAALPTALLAALLLASLPMAVGGPASGAAPGTDPVGRWPLQPEPEVVSAFDPPPTPYAAGHRGVDLLGVAGQPVRAGLPGQVSFAGSIAGRGVVVVAHGPTRTTYEPVAASVTVGTAVAAGQPLGVLQAAPSHCAPRTCLHWGWIEGETYLDPLRLVGAGPVRLLPLGPGGAPVTPALGSFSRVPPLTPLARLLQLRDAVV